MTWAELRNLDVLALPWGDAIRWERRWQVAALLVVWATLWAIFWYNVYEPRQQALVAQSQLAASRSQQLAQAEFVESQRFDLLKAIADHMSQASSKPLREDKLLKRLNREGIFFDAWRQGTLKFHGDWSAVGASLVDLSAHVSWSALSMQSLPSGHIQVELTISGTPVHRQPDTPLAGQYHAGRSPFTVLTANTEQTTPTVLTEPGQQPLVQQEHPSLGKRALGWSYAARKLQALSVPLASMQLLGVVQAGGETVALVQASGQAWRVRVGQRLGSDGQRVQRISPARLTLSMGKALVVDPLRGSP
jgi:hypothetical protein